MIIRKNMSTAHSVHFMDHCNLQSVFGVFVLMIYLFGQVNLI